jgi:hypothetical protein
MERHARRDRGKKTEKWRHKERDIWEDTNGGEIKDQS